MKSKRLAALVALALLVTLSACGGDSGGSSGTVSGGAPSVPAGSGSGSGAGSSASSPEVAALAFQAPDGSTVSIDENMKEVLEDLGKEQSYFEAPSCAFEGLDKTYTYSGFVITTRPDGEEDYVSSIRLTDDSVTTPEGIYVGSSEADVVAAYGEGTRDEAELRYTRDSTALSFILEGDKVVSIEYLAA